MAMIISPDSAYGKELAKWEKPYVFVMFPKMLFKAQRRPDGVISVGESNDAYFGLNNNGDVRPGSAEAFTRTTQKTVNSDAEMSLEIEKGWRMTPQDALAFYESRAKGVADDAAHRAHDDRGMSDLAKKEAAAAETATVEHVAEVPRKRVRGKDKTKRRGRPPKAAA